MKKIDIHCHYGKWPFIGKDSSVDDIVKGLETYDIEAFFLSSSKAVMYDFIEGNKELFIDITGRKGLYGYVTVNPNYTEESINEIIKYKGHPQFVGVKYHPDYCKSDLDCCEMDMIYEFLENNDIPILIHTATGISSPLKILNIKARFPELKVIAAHMGGAHYRLGIELIRKSDDDVFLEICSTDTSFDKIREAVDAAGKERVLFGTDYTLFSPSYTIGAVESSDLSDSEREHIYYLNARRIFFK